MKLKYFLYGVISGVILTIAVFFVIVSASEDSEDSCQFQYHNLEQPVSYENKEETSFKVFQVLGNAALATEVSNKKFKWYNGNTVVILGENFYSDQIVTIKNPQRVGTYSYTNKGGMPMTVPVLGGDTIE